MGMNEDVEISDIDIGDVDKQWMITPTEIYITRIGLLIVLSMMRLALRHPNIPDTIKSIGKGIGLDILNHLINEGIEMPDNVYQAYIKTFTIEEKGDESDVKQRNETNAEEHGRRD